MEKEQYTIEGKIAIDVSYNVDAESKEAAEALAKEAFNDRYTLSAFGSYHNPKTDVKFDLDVFLDSDYE